MNVAAVLFDMDGVLVNSEPVITLASIRALAEFGVTASEADFLPFTGMGEDRFIGGVAEKYGKAFLPEMKRRAYEIYVQIAPEMIEVYKGALPLLVHLEELGIPTTLASSADYIKVATNLAAAKIPERLFRTIITGNDITRKKPFPDIYLLAAERTSANPSGCVVVEDAVSGVQAAKAAGMKCVAVTTSFDERTLREAGADAVCGDISGVWECIEKL